MLDSIKANTLFSYERDTGIVLWRTKTARKVVVGRIAGHINKGDGYRYLKVEGRSYVAHRVIWLMEYGVWPTLQIDHIDGDRLNNRLSNLRDVSCLINMQNIRAAKTSSTTGCLGALRRGDMFVSYIRHNGKRHFLGRFASAEAASDAYVSAKRKHHPGCTI